MKLSFIVVMLSYFLVLSGQEIGNKLKDKSWFATGDLMKSEKCRLTAEKSSSKFNEVKFLPGSKLQMPYESEYGEGIIFVCDYCIKNNKLKIYYIINYEKEKRKENIAHYYKIKEIKNDKEFELIPISESDFK